MTAQPVSFTPAPNPDADNRDDVYFEDDPTNPGRTRLIIRSSAIGGCIRNLVAARFGIKAVSFKEDARRRMNEGVIHEPYILAHLEANGYKVIEQQSVLELPIAGGLIVVRGHSDARVYQFLQDRQAVAEAKAFGRDTYEKWMRAGWAEFRRYAYQLSSYMITTGLPGVFAVKNRDTGEVDVTVWEEPPIPPAELTARALKIKAATELPSCDPVQWGCQRYFIHEGVDFDIDPVTGLEVKKGSLEPPAPCELPSTAVPAVEELARAYAEARDEETRAKAKKKEVGEFLMAALRHHNLKKAETPRWTTSIVESTRSTLDSKGLQTKYPDIYAEFERKSTSTYPKVTPKEEEGGEE